MNNAPMKTPVKETRRERKGDESGARIKPKPLSALRCAAARRRIRRYLPEAAKKIPIFVYEITDSTNRRAAEYIRNGGTLPAIFLSGGQTAGRGRLGRSFVSAAGAGLYISYAIPVRKAADALKITTHAAVAVCLSVEDVSPLDCKVKWVNDIYVSGRKLSGILAEGVTTEDGALSAVVLGIGINIKPEGIPEELLDIATSIEGEGGKAVSRDRLAARLTSRLLPLLIGRAEDFFTPDSLMEYRRRSLVIGQNIRVIHGGTEYPARATGITDAGALSIVREDGSQETLSTGEITVRLR